MQTPEFDRRSAATAIAVFGGPQASSSSRCNLISVEATKSGKATMKKRKGVIDKQDAEREAILDERETLRRQFPANYSPDVGVFSDGKVEIMFKLTYSEAEKLARLLREQKK
jgi:hypothetical protein